MVTCHSCYKRRPYKVNKSGIFEKQVFLFDGICMLCRLSGDFSFLFLSNLFFSKLEAYAGRGSEYSFVGPSPPTKCLEQINVSFLMFSTVKYFLPQSRTNHSHFSSCVFGFRKGMKQTPAMSSLLQTYLESLLPSP